MRIHLIRLRNLNSLRTDVALDFDQPPLAYAGLFVITGETGAGKTTLLDAITLALFGRTSRDHQKEVMSNGALECFAEVEFSNENGRFLARWEQRKKRKSDNLETQRILSRWENGQYAVLHSGLQAMSKQVERYLGMNYEQFKRTVLLAQGEFAAFLTSDEKDKAAVLERLTSTEIYSQLSKAAHEKHKEEKSLLTQLEGKRADLQLFTAEEVSARQTELAEKTSRSLQLQENQDQLRSNQVWLDGLQALQQKQAQLKAELSRLAREEEDFQPQQQRLLRHRQARPLQVAVRRLQELETEQETLVLLAAELEQASASHAIAKIQLDDELQSAEQALDAAYQALRAAETVFEKVIQLDAQISGETVALENQHHESAQFLAETTRLQKQIADGKASRQRVQEEIKSLQTWLTKHQNLATLGDEIQKAEAYIVRLQQLKPQGEHLEQQRRAALLECDALNEIAQQRQAEEQHAAAQLAAHQTQWQQLLADNQLPDTEIAAENALDQRVATATEKVQQLEDFARYFRDYRRVADELEKVQARYDQLLVQEKSLAAGLQKLLVHEIPELEMRCQTKRARYEFQQQSLRLSDVRAALRPGQPCPVCGSKQHSLENHSDANTLENDAQEEWDAAEKALLEAQKRQAALETERKALGETLLELGKTLEGNLRDEVQTLYTDLCQRQPESSRLEQLLAAPIVEQMALLQKQTEGQRLEKERLETLRTRFNALMRALRQDQAQRSEAQASLREVETLLQINARDQANIAQNRADWQQAVAAESAALDPLLAPFGFAYSAESVFEENFNALQRDIRQFSEKEKLLDGLIWDYEKRETKIEAQESQLKERRQEEEKQQQKLELGQKSLETLRSERSLLFGDQNPQAERNSRHEQIDRLNALLQDLQQQQKGSIQRAAQLAETQKANQQNQQKNQTQRSRQLAEIQAALQKTDFPDRESLLDALLTDEVAAQLEQQAESLRTRLSTAQQNRFELEREFLAEEKRDFAHRESAVLLDEIKRAEASLQALQQEIGALKTRLADNEQRAHLSEVLLQQIERQRIELNRWEALRKLIGSDNGARFRTFAQSLTLQQLVQRANQHLAKLQGGRYRLRKKAGAELDLEIVDRFQADYARSVITLSGGETFLASLALALGLADMTGGQTSRVQSLFIDEGFGSLDENALEMAVVTLESLQVNGVAIGIISHVRELKERIGIQVRVTRKSDGFSKVEVAG